MFLQPKKQKYRKQMRGKNKGLSNRGFELKFGSYGLKALERGLITARQIEAARRAITGSTKRTGKLWINIFPDKPVTKKPIEVRMGKGKGQIDHYAAVIKPGRIIFEIDGIDQGLATKAFQRASIKLPIKTKLIVSDNI